jgi:hypothetical protein
MSGGGQGSSDGKQLNELQRRIRRAGRELSKKGHPLNQP